jgi:adenine C2-methylase RlmN of 23S rRNA A2503 and tRNA A37
LQELEENFKKNMPVNIKLSLDNYKKNVKRELMRLKEKKKFSKLKLEKLNA